MMKVTEAMRSYDEGGKGMGAVLVNVYKRKDYKVVPFK